MLLNVSRINNFIRCLSIALIIVQKIKHRYPVYFRNVENNKNVQIAQ